MTELSAHLHRTYGETLAHTIQAGFVEKPVTLRVNTLKTSALEVFSVLSNWDVQRVPWYDDALILPHATEQDLQKTALYEEGKIYLQSLSSMLPPLYLEPKAGENILDMTAAPGGKTCELYALSEGKALITACERDKIRFERLKFNLARQGATRVSALQRDATMLDDFLSFDKILLDAPCTGSGTATPKYPVRFSEQYLEKCVRMQEALLKKALKLLKRGGTLVYSTCSVLKEENEELLARVLPTAGARLVPIEPYADLPLLPSMAGTVAVCPNELYEGFFVAKITK